MRPVFGITGAPTRFVERHMALKSMESGSTTIDLIKPRKPSSTTSQLNSFWCCQIEETPSDV